MQTMKNRAAHERIDRLEERMDERFDRVDAEFGLMDSRFQVVEADIRELRADASMRGLFTLGGITITCFVALARFAS